MNILVVGGTGTVGSHVVTALAARGLRPRVLSRSRDRAANVSAGAAGVVGDLSRPSSIANAFKGIDRVALITAVGEHETREGLAAVEAARRAGVSRIVFLSVHDVEQCAEAPHFMSKIDIAQAIAHAGIPLVLVMPNNFFQNDLRYRDAIVTHGLYPQPIGGIGLSRVDARDVADAMVTCCTEDGHDGERYPVVGAEVLTGAGTADVWSRHLGRPVAYAGDDLDGWAARAGRSMPDWLARDMRIMYAFFQKRGLRASEHDFAQQARVLGHPPRRYDDFVGQTLAAWRSAPATRAAGRSGDGT